MNRNYLILSTLVFLNFSAVYAAETVGTQVGDAVDNSSRDIKKGTRKVGRKARKATGTDTVGKDINDAAHDANDDASAGASKIKRHINND